MIRRVAAEEHYAHRNDWLSARWHFSFAEYHDSENISFGPIRVFNDDRVQPGRGFDFHPHRDMEIVTCVFSGRLEHEDDRGNKGILGAGDVQVMSAGTGIIHAERNPSDVEPLHLAQIWLLPWRRGGEPRYGQKTFPAEARKGVLLPVVSRESKIKGTLPVHQDAYVYLADLAPGEKASHSLLQARHAYVFLAEGSGSVNEVPMAAGDAARIHEEETIDLGGGAGARFVLIDTV